MRKMTHQTHHQAIIIRPTTVTTDAHEIRGRAIGKQI